MPASEDICIVELIHTTPLLLSVSLLLFSFLPSFCFVNSSQERQCQAHMQSFTAFGCLPINVVGSWNIFSPLSPPSPGMLGSLSHSHPDSRQSQLLPEPLIPATYQRLPISQSHLSPVLHLSVANLMLVHVLVSQCTCAVVTGTRRDTPDVSFKWSVERVLRLWLHAWYKLVYNHVTDLPLAACSCLFHPHNQSQWLCGHAVSLQMQKNKNPTICMFPNQINKWCQCLVCLHNY